LKINSKKRVPAGMATGSNHFTLNFPKLEAGVGSVVWRKKPRTNGKRVGFHTRSKAGIKPA